MNVYFTFLCMAFAAATPRDALDTAVATVRHQESLLTKCRITWRLESSAEEGSSGAALQGTGATEHRELWDGLRYRDQIKGKSHNGKELVDLQYDAGFDGKQLRSQIRERQIGVVSDRGRRTSSYLSRAYFEDRPLSAFLDQVLLEGDAEWVQVDGRQLLRCTRTKEPLAGVESRLTMWLDRQNGWQPRRIEFREGVPPGMYPDGRTSVGMVSSVTKYVKTADVVIPAAFKRESTYLGADGRTVRDGTEHYELIDFEVDPVVADTDFQVPIPQGMQVVDGDRQVTYIQGEPGTERSIGGSRRTLADLTPDGARWTWWGDSRVWWALCSVFVAMLGGMLWRDRRLRSRP